VLGLSPHARFFPSPQGMTSEVVFVDDRGRELALKRCRRARYLKWLRRERVVLEALSQSALPVPRLVAADDDSLLMTRLRGESFWDVVRRAPSPQRADAFGKLGALMRTLHDTPVPAALRTDASWFDRVFDLARADLPWTDGTPDLLDELIATQPAPVPERLIHGDLGLDNVLITADGALSLIDWSTGCSGDPRYDLAIALATEPELTLRDADVAAFYDAYNTPPLSAEDRRWFVRLYEFF
jgi:aminoglycoside phosphotransferase (APT) family kinase protein